MAWSVNHVKEVRHDTLARKGEHMCLVLTGNPILLSPATKVPMMTRNWLRGLRRRQNQWLHMLRDADEALVPHRLECPYNNTFNWERDGRQHLVFPGSQGSARFDFKYRYWVKLHRK